MQFVISTSFLISLFSFLVPNTTATLYQVLWRAHQGPFYKFWCVFALRMEQVNLEQLSVCYINFVIFFRLFLIEAGSSKADYLNIYIYIYICLYIYINIYMFI
jgi:hypothetical protein